MNKESSDIDTYDHIELIKQENSEMRMEDVFLNERIEEQFEYPQENPKQINEEIINETFTKISEINQIENLDKKSKKYKMHSIEVKRKCLELSQYLPLKKISETFDVPIKSLKRWLIVGAERKKGGGRKIRDPEMERKLFEWYKEVRIIQNQPVTSRMIKAKALELTKLEDFNASKGWLEKIKKKYKLQISRSTNALK